MSPLHPEVIAGFRAFSVRFEGCVAWMYLDVRGLVTTGIGCLVDPLELALELPWYRPDWRWSTRDEIEAEWRRVKAMPPGLRATRYAGPLRLSDEAIDQLVARRLEGNAARLLGYFPELADWPAPAQTALCSMAWAMGANFVASWPRFAAAARAQDWRACADECAIRADGNPGVVPRNEANRDLFLAAAEA